MGCHVLAGKEKRVARSRDVPGCVNRPSVGLRIREKIFAIYNDAELILKLPANRVGELTDSGKGRPWGPGTGRIMKEWVAVSAAASEDWPALAAEARTFVGSG